MSRSRKNKPPKRTQTIQRPQPAPLPNTALQPVNNYSELLAVKTDESNLDYLKLAIEDKKIDLERDKLFVSSLIEDFKARWQELLNFENENSRWQTLYVTALILVVSWILSNSGETGKYKTVKSIFDGDNAYLLISLALINAIYTLAMAYKGYQIQEIAQYLYKNIGNEISIKINKHEHSGEKLVNKNDKQAAEKSVEFNGWERWRRDEKGTPKFIRTFYYIIVSGLPTAVSATILGLFYHYRYPVDQAGEWLNFFFWVSSGFVLITFLAALYTTRMNRKWTEILERQISRE